MTAIKVLWGPSSLSSAPNSAMGSGNALNDADNSVAFVFCVPKDGTIEKIGFYVTARTGTPPAYNVGLVTIDAGGIPTTTNYGGSATKSATFGSTGWAWVTLDTPATANAGDICVARIWPGGTPPDGSNFITVSYDNFLATMTKTPYSTYYTSMWLSGGSCSIAAVQYQTTGEVYGFPITAVANDSNISTSTTPDESGAKFQLPMAVKCCGARICLASGISSAFSVVLYDANNTVLASWSIADEDMYHGNGAGALYDYFWDAVDLAANTDYRLVVKPTSTTAVSTVFGIQFDAVASRTNNILIPEASRWMKTVRTDAGAWTDSTDKMPWMALWLSDITVSAPAGGAHSSGFMG